MTNNKTLQKLDKFLNEEGLNAFELIQLIGECKSSLLNMSDENAQRFDAIYEKLCSQEIAKEEKGGLLEDLTAMLFWTGHARLFECRRNCRTSTNEIDVQINWTQQARLAGTVSAFPCFGESFLCECKNYSGKVDVTYVGKFYSLLKVSHMKLGILIAWEGVTGRSAWTDSLGLIKKIALRDEIFIIPLDKKDLGEIRKNTTNIFELIYSKYQAMKCEIDYSQYVSRHENEEGFSANIS